MNRSQEWISTFKALRRFYSITCSQLYNNPCIVESIHAQVKQIQVGMHQPVRHFLICSLSRKRFTILKVWPQVNEFDADSKVVHDLHEDYLVFYIMYCWFIYIHFLQWRDEKWNERKIRIRNENRICRMTLKYKKNMFI